MRTHVQHVEAFQLALLRILEARLDRANWVVKGGVNLRAWFGSRRYSEDLDLDVIRCPQHLLRERVDKVLHSSPLADLLATQGLAIARVSRPKQTETTQRWKIELEASGVSVPLHTKLEFSRRPTRLDEHALEPVRGDAVRPYGIPAPTANHYTARSAIRQKIQALAARSEAQARDVWDIEHLVRTTQADPRPFPAELRLLVPEAIERALSIGYDTFRAQVVPYLAADDQTLYGSREAWDRMCELVAERLQEVRS